jgi:hypothetical protein
VAGRLPEWFLGYFCQDLIVMAGWLHRRVGKVGEKEKE